MIFQAKSIAGLPVAYHKTFGPEKEILLPFIGITGGYNWSCFGVNHGYKCHYLPILSQDYIFFTISEKAMFKGVGNINGVPGYKFMISAIDNEESGDKFGIKIWEEAGSEEWVIYDNQKGASKDSDPVSGLIRGSIKIHNPKGNSKTDTSSGITSAELFTLAVYPNPLESDGIWLNFSERSIDEVFDATIFDLYGRPLTSTKLSVSASEGEYFWQVDHNGWAQGVYLLLVRNGNQEFRIKLIK